MQNDTIENRPSRKGSRGQQGTVMLMILLLVIMFTGLGLMAMRHTQGEVRAAGSYFDVIQAEALAISPCAFLATDLRANYDYPVAAIGLSSYPNYKEQFALNPNGGPVAFSPALDGQNYDAGCLPNDQLSGTVPLADTPILGAANADVSINYGAPETAPAMAGYSHSNDEGTTYAFYYFTFTSRASFGGEGISSMDRGRAAARCRLWVGPLSAL